MRKTLLTGCIAALILASGTARAELKVTLTIDGDVDEMIAVLQQLQLLGLGTPAAEDDAMKLHVKSVHDQEAEAPKAEPKPPEPVLALTRPAATPETVAPGGELTLSVAVIDERRAVDTLSASVIGTGIAFDLFDNGTHGDETPADGVWTATITVPPSTPEGEYDATFFVYDGAGNALTAPTEDGGNTAVTANTKVTVAVPTAEEEAASAPAADTAEVATESE